MWAHLTVRPGISMCCRGGKSKRRGGRAMPDQQRSVQVGSAIRSSRPAAGWHLNGHFGLVPPRDGISTVILISSRHGIASQQPFWSRPAAGWHLNGHFGLVPPRDSISTAILVPSRLGMASQRSFWSRPAAGWRLNSHFGPVPPRDSISTVILISSRRGMPRRTSQSMSSGPPSGEISSIRHTFLPEVARASIFACA